MRPLDEPLLNLCIDLMEPLFGAICLVRVRPVTGVRMPTIYGCGSCSLASPIANSASQPACSAESPRSDFNFLNSPRRMQTDRLNYRR